MVNSDGGHQSVTSYAIGVSHYRLGADKRSSTVMEVMGLAGFLTGEVDGSQFGAGIGIGFQGVYRVIVPRIEAVFEQWFESEFVSKLVVKVVFGFSFCGPR